MVCFCSASGFGEVVIRPVCAMSVSVGRNQRYRNTRTTAPAAVAYNALPKSGTGIKERSLTVARITVHTPIIPPMMTE
ncbi:hypothetical protein ES703_80611 [subsurface metagenome]